MTQTDLSAIPIDIHANRLLDWLISRRHCNKDWPEKIEGIRQKINEAIKDMPENATIAKILVGASPINYYHCVKIVEVLKETEAESKNIFGMYGSSRMKDWQEILKNYQRDHLYLSESASILARNVVYEIPSLKRLITKLEQSQTEMQKKEVSCKKQAQESRDKFLSSCRQLGLTFDAQSADSPLPSVASVGKQLTSQMEHELPIIFNKIADNAKDVKDGVLYYRRFLKSVAGLSDQDEKDCLGLLLFLIEKGNLTTYEWKHGEAPLKIEAPELVNYSFEEEEGDNGTTADLEIDFGDLGSGGDDITLETGDIDWGDIEIAPEGEAQIDFSVDDVEIGAAGITLEEDGIEGGVARNEEALSVLENAETREQFINDLVELEGFLSQRIDEVKSQKSNELSLTSQEDDSLTLAQLEKLVKIASQLYNMFNETKTKQFLLVRESKRYVIRLAESLLQNLKLAKKLDYGSEDAKNRAVQYGKETEELRPRIQVLTKQCRELQTELAKEISKKYDNRTVYITGGV